MDVRKILMKKDLREWKAGEIRENVSNNEAVYLELEGYAEIIKDEAAEVAPVVPVAPVEETPEVVKPKRVYRRRRAKELKAASPRPYKTKTL